MIMMIINLKSYATRIDTISQQKKEKKETPQTLGVGTDNNDNPFEIALSMYATQTDAPKSKENTDSQQAKYSKHSKTPNLPGIDETKEQELNCNNNSRCFNWSRRER